MPIEIFCVENNIENVIFPIFNFLFLFPTMFMSSIFNVFKCTPSILNNF